MQLLRKLFGAGLKPTILACLAFVAVQAQDLHPDLTMAEALIDGRSVGAFQQLVDREGHLRFRASRKDLSRLLIKAAGIGIPSGGLCGNDDLEWKRQGVLRLSMALVNAGAFIDQESLAAAIRGENPRTFELLLSKSSPSKEALKSLMGVTARFGCLSEIQALIACATPMERQGWPWESWMLLALEADGRHPDGVLARICLEGNLSEGVKWKGFFHSLGSNALDERRLYWLKELGLDPSRDRVFMNPAQRDMLDAIDRDRADEVVQALARGADVSSVDAQGRTPLILAVKRCDLRVVKALLEAGASPFQPTALRWAESLPLTLAASMGQLPLVQMLFDPRWAKEGDRITCVNCPPPICWAVASGHREVFDWLQKHGTIADQSCTKADLLSAAAAGNQLDLVRGWVSDPESDPWGKAKAWTRKAYGRPFTEAAEHGSLEVLMYLWELAEKDQTDPQVGTALIFASMKGQLPVVRWLATHCNPQIKAWDAEQAMFEGLKHGYMEIAAITAPLAVLSHPRNPYRTHDEGIALLAEGWPEGAVLMRSYGWDPSCTDQTGKNALHHALSDDAMFRPHLAPDSSAVRAVIRWLLVEGKVPPIDHSGHRLSAEDLPFAKGDPELTKVLSN